MFVVIYEFTVKQEMKDQFRENWLKYTEGIYRYSGSLGSRLHKPKNNIFVAYAQWPDRETWKDAGEVKFPDEYETAGGKMREALSDFKVLYELEVDRDYLQNQLFNI